MNGVDVITGSRLHFGLLCGDAESEWHYGGIGLMIDTPSWRLNISRSRSDEDAVAASPAATTRIANLLDRFRQIRQVTYGYDCTVIQEMNFHSGLGAGTQLTLAVATALLLLNHESRPADVTPIAEKLGRRRRSSIGTYGFDHGGFIVDRGKSMPNRCQRVSFPDDWRIILITPATSEGLSGTQEENFFGEKDFLDRVTLREITELIESKIKTSLSEQDFQTFASSLAKYGRLIGDYYSSGQGGVYSSPLIQQLANWSMARNLPIPVQSSWGPTACVPAASSNHADSIVEAIRLDRAVPPDTSITVTRGRNVGAAIRSMAVEDQRSFG